MRHLCSICMVTAKKNVDLCKGTKNRHDFLQDWWERNPRISSNRISSPGASSTLRAVLGWLLGLVSNGVSEALSERLKAPWCQPQTTGTKIQWKLLGDCRKPRNAVSKARISENSWRARRCLLLYSWARLHLPDQVAVRADESLSYSFLVIRMAEEPITPEHTAWLT